jgi:hypothetical protein
MRSVSFCSPPIQKERNSDTYPNCNQTKEADHDPLPKGSHIVTVGTEAQQAAVLGDRLGDQGNNDLVTGKTIPGGLTKRMPAKEERLQCFW